MPGVLTNQSKLSRTGPALAVVALHVGIIYVLSVSMGIVKTPEFVQPLQAVFIPEAQESEPEPPAVKPEIADLQPVETQPMPQIEFEEPVVPPAENPMPAASSSAISATESSGGAAQELRTSQRVEPVYPAMSRRLSEEGTVLLRILVDEKGRPQDVKVANSSGFQRLDDAAMQAVRRWRFVAASNGQQPIQAWTQVSITFRLTA